MPPARAHTTPRATWRFPAAAAISATLIEPTSRTRSPTRYQQSRGIVARPERAVKGFQVRFGQRPAGGPANARRRGAAGRASRAQFSPTCCGSGPMPSRLRTFPQVAFRRRVPTSPCAEKSDFWQSSSSFRRRRTPPSRSRAAKPQVGVFRLRETGGVDCQKSDFSACRGARNGQYAPNRGPEQMFHVKHPGGGGRACEPAVPSPPRHGRGWSARVPGAPAATFPARRPGRRNLYSRPSSSIFFTKAPV